MVISLKINFLKTNFTFFMGHNGDKVNNTDEPCIHFDKKMIFKHFKCLK
jgi:hypothetical protein